MLEAPTSDEMNLETKIALFPIVRSIHGRNLFALVDVLRPLLIPCDTGTRHWR